MFGYKMTDYDKEVYNNELKDFLPEKIIDIHTHVYKGSFDKWGTSSGTAKWVYHLTEELEIEDLIQTYKDMLPGKTVIPNIFGTTEVDLKQSNDYVRECGQKYNFPYMYRLSYDTPIEQIEREVVEGGFYGFKPYLSNRPPYIPVNEIRIFDFMPKEQFALADKLGLTVILHIAKPDRLKDPLNIAQLMEIEEKYPNVKLVVAHIGRAYSDENLGDAFDTLKHTKNMLFDFSANTHANAMEVCINSVGTDRVLFGSDMPITKMTMYRIVENGEYINVVPRGMYGDVSDDPRMRETDEPNITNFLYEELRSFKKVSEKLGLTKKDIEKIMCSNAERILGL